MNHNNLLYANSGLYCIEKERLSKGYNDKINNDINHMALELLENQMKRLEQSTALGMWDFATYVLSEDQNVANNVAHTYLDRKYRLMEK
ncbi:MAG: hypothetical protein ACRC7N_10260 [Clostridium sp.]